MQQDESPDAESHYSDTDSDVEALPLTGDTSKLASVQLLEPGEPLDDSESRPHPSFYGAEYDVATSTKLFYLTGWFLLNLILTLYNKAIINEFAFPWLITCLHCTFVSVGCSLLLLGGTVKLTRLSWKDNLILNAFSFLFTLNIALSNVSLALVSVAFHQIIRSTGPVWTILIQRLCFGRLYPTNTILSCSVIISGVVMVTFGEYHFTLVGFLLTLLGIILASVKSVASNRIMTGQLSLSPIELLLRLSPTAALQSLAYAYVNGELSGLSRLLISGQLTSNMYLALIGNGTVAFALNYFSFQTNRRAGALTLSIAGNLKQSFTILLGILLFSVPVGWLNGIGTVIVMGGAAWYSSIEVAAKSKQ